MTSDQRASYWLGFDLGGTKMLASVYDGKFQVRGRKRRKTKGSEGSESVTSRMVRTMHEALDEAQVALSDVRGIGIGIPGPVDQENGIVLQAVNMNWRNLKLAKLMKDELGCPVVLLNDVDAGIYGEYRYGAAKGARTALGVFPGTGIGGGCVYDGQIIRGSKNSCLEIGHVTVTPNGRLCGCGLRGCLETEASRLAISADVAMAAFRGEAPTIMNEAGANLAEIRSSLLAKSIAAGEKAVHEIVLRAARVLGTALGGCVHLLSPDVVVLGGGLVDAMPDIYVPAVIAAAKKSVMPSLVDTFEIVPAKLADDAAVLGAAAWAEHVFQT